MKRSLIALFLIVASLLGLVGCSGLRIVDSDVQSFAALPAGQTLAAGSRYRFERLPSQAQSPAADRLEALAAQALTRVGLQPGDAAAPWTVQVGARVEQVWVGSWGDPWGGPWWPGTLPGGVYPGGHLMIGSGGMWGMGWSFPAQTEYRREVSLILRDAKSHQVVYETRAVHAGPWHDTDTVLGAMFDAALKDFPRPPAGVRRVNIEIPR